MRTYRQWRTYRELELIPITEPKLQLYAFALLSGLYDCFMALREILALKSEIQIWQAIDPLGKSYWKVYDPIDDDVHYLDSEQDILIWLEERHKQKTR